MKYFAKFLVLAWCLGGCQGDDSVTSLALDGYAALETGRFQVYSVNEVHYLAGQDPVAVNYELRTEVTDSFPSSNGYVYVMSRSRREPASEAWEPLDTWSVRQTGSEVVVSEGNVPYVKIKYPVNTYNSWNGNAYNAKGHDEFRYSDVNTPFEVGTLTFNNTIAVEQERNDDRIVFRDERREVYALNVGMVYKELIQFSYCTDDACLGQEKVDHGIEMRMAITEYGKQ